MKFGFYLLTTFLMVFLTYGRVIGEEWGNMHISYIREVNNQLFLSDFQLGSEESIRDKNGHGVSLAG